MASETPPFWWERPGLFSALLLPLSLAYAPLARRNFKLQGRDVVDVPILCVANLAIGATGKTPVAIALGRRARELGLRPGFVSRGPAGANAQPHLVDAGHDSARHVGEEALELARCAPVAVSARRAAGARLLAAEGCDIVILLDGFAGARVTIDYVLIVVDAKRGLGNGRVVPAGPVRAPLVDQLRHANGVVFLGDGQGADRVVRLVSRAGRPVYLAGERVRSGIDLSGRRFLAFSAIGAPEQFHAMIEAAGGEVVVKRTFAPGHHYTLEEAGDIAGLARQEGLDLITTVRDAISLSGTAMNVRSQLGAADVLEIEVAFETADVPGRIVAETVEAWQRRHGRRGASASA